MLEFADYGVPAAVAIALIARELLGVVFRRTKQTAEVAKLQAETSDIASARLQSRESQLIDELHREVGRLREEVSELRRRCERCEDDRIELHQELSQLRYAYAQVKPSP